MDYKCPYCGQDSYSKTSKKSGKFTDWSAVARHTSKCIKNSHIYYISKYYGPMHFSIFLNKDVDIILLNYPKLTGSIISDEVQKFKKYNIISLFYSNKEIKSKQELISSLQQYVKIYNKIPNGREWQNSEFPKPTQIIKKFGSWNNYIIESGFEPNIQNGFGIDTYGLDGHLYRSSAEAYFADNYLFEQYEYEIEPKYPNNTWYYDWYIKDLDLYIELDGGIRPERIKQKIKLNKKLSKNCLFINIKDIYKKDFKLLELLS